MRVDGAGLGLAVVRRLTEAMDGKVWVEDGPDGSGARFRFEAAFEATAIARDRPLTGCAVALRIADPLVRASAAVQIEASGGRVADDAPIVLVDHALAARAGRPGPVTRVRTWPCSFDACLAT